MVRRRNSSGFTRKRLAIGIALIGMIGILNACAQTDGSALPFQSPRIVETDSGATERREYRVVSASNDTIALTEWKPDEQPKAVILAVHGYGDYGSSTFDEAARDWAKRGLTTYAYDQRGFGRNPSNGDWPGHRALVDDLASVATLIRERHNDLPVIVLGHSMGGAVVAAAVGEGAINADRMVLLAPALWGGKYLNSALRAMAGVANAVAPNKRWTGDGIVKIQASDNIEMLRGLGRDPLYVRNPSSREFVGLIRIMDRAVDAAGSIGTPALVIYGAKDEVIPEDPIISAYDRFAGEKRYVKVETGWHMLLRDLEGATVRALVADFALASDAQS